MCPHALFSQTWSHIVKPHVGKYIHHRNKLGAYPGRKDAKQLKANQRRSTIRQGEATTELPYNFNPTQST